MASILKRSYKVQTDDGRTIVKKCRHYTIEFTVNGKRKRVKGHVDKGATLQLASRLERDAARGVEGLTDPYREHRIRNLSDHLTDYLDSLQSQGCDDKYIANMKMRINILIKECGWTTLAEVDSNSFLKWRNQQSTKTRRGTFANQHGASASTQNQYLESSRAFLNWLATQDRVAGVAIHGGSRKISVLLAGVGKVAGEKRRNRRALSDEDVAKLLAVSPADRAIVYRVGFSVGLRRSELEALQWGDLRLAAIPPYVQLRAQATKARRADRVHFPTSLADDLRKLRPDGATDSSPVFASVAALELWKDDLKSAGIPFTDEMGRVCDFHGGTRKTLCSRMHRNGVPLAHAMKVMRHTSASLTLVDYCDDSQIGLGNVLPEVVATPKVEVAAQQAS